jgi:hypothetical protein
MTVKSRETKPWGNRKLFTVEQANAVLPLVRAITADLARLSSEVVERRERLSALQAGRERGARDVYSQELTQIEDELKCDVERLQEYAEELQELGVDPKNFPEGLVDFPAVMDGRAVYLCWKLGEPEVLHWHDKDAGFPGRQPLTAGNVAAGSLIAGSTDGEGDDHGLTINHGE